MNKLMQNIKANKAIFLWSFILTLLNFGIDYSIEYATDTYSTFNEKGTWYHVTFENGRPLKSLIYYIFESLNVPGSIIYHLSQATAIILLTASVAFLAIILKNYLSKEWLSLLISFATIVNPFFIEFMLYEEKSLFMLVILLNIIAFRINEKRWSSSVSTTLLHDVLLIQLCLWTSVFIYQTSIQMYVILSLPFIVIWCKDIKDFLLKNLFVMVMYGIPMTSAYLLAKFFLPVERLNNHLNLMGKLKNFADIFRFVNFEKFYNLKQGLFLLWLFIMLISAIAVIISIRRKRLLVAFNIAYIALGCLVTSFLLFITGSSTVIWPRMIYTYGMLFGIISFYIAYIAKDLPKEFKLSIIPISTSVVLLCFILVFDYISFGKIFLERHRANQEDLYYAEIIGQRIAEYEEETGNTIDTICYYKDYNICVFGRGFEKSMLNERAQASGWSRHNSIEIYLDKKFKQGEPDQKLQEYFSQKDWNMYSEDQLIFDKNTLHICVY